MDRFFDTNNPLMRFLSRAVDLAVLNLLTILFSLPVITMGASLSAMNYVLLKLRRREETYVWKMFLQSFKTNLKQGIALGIIYLIFAAAVGADLMILHMIDSRLATWLMLFITFVAFIVLVSGVYTFALQSRFENTVRGTLANGWKMLIGYPVQSIIMLIIWIVWGVFATMTYRGMSFFFLLYGISIPGLLCTLFYEPIFRRMEAEANRSSGKEEE